MRYHLKCVYIYKSKLYSQTIKINASSPEKAKQKCESKLRKKYPTLSSLALRVKDNINKNTYKWYKCLGYIGHGRAKVITEYVHIYIKARNESEVLRKVPSTIPYHDRQVVFIKCRSNILDSFNELNIDDNHSIIL